MKLANEPLPIDPGVTGFVLQIGLITLVEMTRRLFGLSKRVESGERKEDDETAACSLLSFPSRPKWDIPKLERFGENHLAPELIWKSMEVSTSFHDNC